MSLFSGQSTSEYGQRAIRSAVAIVESLTFDNFEERAVSTINAEVSKAAIATPKLDFEKRSGRRISEEKRVRDYNREVTRKFDYIDVTVPFSGNFIAFELSPTAQIMGTRGEVNDRKNGIVFRLPDDERLEADLNNAVSQIQQNLGNFQRDMEALATEMQSILQGVADRRLEKLRSQRDLDGKRSFPISQ